MAALFRIAFVTSGTTSTTAPRPCNCSPDSPNAGGVYKVWVTPLARFDPAGGKYHGFAPSDSKTDAFRVVYAGGLPD